MFAMIAEWKDLEALTFGRVQWRSEVGSSGENIILSCLEVRLVLIERTASKQKEDPLLAQQIRKLRDRTESDDLKDFSLDHNGWLRKKGRLCVLNIGDMRKEVLDECYRSKFTIHPGGTKMYPYMK